MKSGDVMKRILVIGFFVSLSVGGQVESWRPDVDVQLPSEVFNSGRQRVPPCQQCCIWRDQNYSQGAIIKVEGILLQCQRDDKTLGSNPLIWQRIKP